MSYVRWQRLGRCVCAAAGGLLLASLFLSWSEHGKGDFLVLFGALDRFGGFFENSSQDAWQSYAFADVDLVALAVLLVVVAVVAQTRLFLLAGLLTVSALVFTISQFFDPPSFHVPSDFPPGVVRAARRAGVDVTASSGVGEIVATVALFAAMSGQILFALACRRRRDQEPLGEPKASF